MICPNCGHEIPPDHTTTAIITAAQTLVDLLDGYKLNQELSAASEALLTAVNEGRIREGILLLAGEEGQPEKTPWKRRGPSRGDYSGYRRAVEENAKLPPGERRTQDEIARSLGISRMTLRKAVRGK